MTSQFGEKPTVLVTGSFLTSEPMANAFNVIPFSSVSEISPKDRSKVRAIAAAGKQPINAAFMDEFPNLEIVANFGVGYDKVDIDAANERKVIVTNTPDVLTDEVADFTLGLLLATVRRIPAGDRFVRSGAWGQGKAFPFTASLRNRKIGVLGLGRIGAAIARRCAAMDLDIAYYSRSKKSGNDYQYFDDVTALAQAVDVLIVITPGGAETAGLVSEKVISALGSNGILINVARGTVVDEVAMIHALKNGGLLAAGLDVFQAEPQVPQELRELDNVVLMPHAGSATNETRTMMGDLLVGNLTRWFSGKGALTPVNG